MMTNNVAYTFLISLQIFSWLSFWGVNRKLCKLLLFSALYYILVLNTNCDCTVLFFLKFQLTTSPLLPVVFFFNTSNTLCTRVQPSPLTFSPSPLIHDPLSCHTSLTFLHMLSFYTWMFFLPLVPLVSSSLSWLELLLNGD